MTEENIEDSQKFRERTVIKHRTPLPPEQGVSILQLWLDNIQGTISLLPEVTHS